MQQPLNDPSGRIEQFRKMAQDDPNNELGHWALGRALADAGQWQEAAQCFARVLQLQPAMCRAYDQWATCLERLGERPRAVEVLTRGVQVAAERRELSLRAEMARRLAALGAPVPELPAAAAQQVGEGQVLCSRCGQVGPKLPRPPFRNQQGETIHAKVCNNCWREWIAMGTKVINELRLPLADPQAQRIYDAHMIEFLNLGGE